MLEWGECESRPTAPLHSRPVRSDLAQLNFRLSTLTFGLPTKLQHIRCANLRPAHQTQSFLIGVVKALLFEALLSQAHSPKNVALLFIGNAAHLAVVRKKRE